MEDNSRRWLYDKYTFHDELRLKMKDSDLLSVGGIKPSIITLVYTPGLYWLTRTLVVPDQNKII